MSSISSSEHEVDLSVLFVCTGLQRIAVSSEEVIVVVGVLMILDQINTLRCIWCMTWYFW